LKSLNPSDLAPAEKHRAGALSPHKKRSEGTYLQGSIALNIRLSPCINRTRLWTEFKPEPNRGDRDWVRLVKKELDLLTTV